MKSAEASDESRAAQEGCATPRKLSVAELFASWDGSHATDPAEQYLALLAWVALHHAFDFADFVSHQPSARRYLKLNANEVNVIRRQHHARQIGGTHYWAVMDIDDDAKSRFVRRLLEFIGFPDEAVTETLRVLALTPSGSERNRLLSLA